MHFSSSQWLSHCCFVMIITKEELRITPPGAANDQLGPGPFAAFLWGIPFLTLETPVWCPPQDLASGTPVEHVPAKPLHLMRAVGHCSPYPLNTLGSPARGSTLLTVYKNDVRGQNREAGCLESP